MNIKSLKEIETIEQARELKDSLFWYPSHSIECLLITDIFMLEWIKKTTINNEVNPTVKQLNEAYSHLMDMKHEIQLIHAYANLDLINHKNISIEYYYNGIDGYNTVLQFNCGVTCLYSNGKKTYLKTVLKNILEHYEIVRIKYNSPLHNTWNLYVSD